MAASTEIEIVFYKMSWEGKTALVDAPNLTNMLNDPLFRGKNVLVETIERAATMIHSTEEAPRD
jgi:hypothetical protein